MTALAGGVALLGLAACGGGAGETELPVATRSVERHPVSGIDTPQGVVVDTPEQWARLWSQHTANRPETPRPEVNFTTHQVLAVFLGSRPSGCSEVTVSAVVDRGAQRVVRHVERLPGPTEVCVAMVTSPAHLVEVPRSAKAVVFEGSQRAGG